MGDAVTARMVANLTWVAGAAAPVFLLTGDIPSAVVAAVPAVAGIAWLHRRRAPRPDEWVSSTAAPTSTRRSATERTAPASALGVARALGRVEAREQALSPWTGVGLAFALVMVVSFAPSYDGHESWGEIVQDVPFLAHALVGMALLAGHAASRRDRRDGVDELSVTCPTSPRVRTASQLAAAWVPAAILLAWAIGYLVVVDRVVAPAGDRAGIGAVATILTGVVLGVGGVALGVFMGQLTTNVLAPIAVLAAIGAISPQLATDEEGGIGLQAMASTMTGVSDGAPVLTAGQAWLHLLWLMVLATCAVAAALVTSGSRRPSAPGP